uniref:DNA-binding protein n=1 Tax=Haemonchus contortus TaxID=6289 RepID=W6ND37_HAECO
MHNLQVAPQVHDYSIDNEDRPGRSVELDLDVLWSQMEADPYQTTRELAVTLGESAHKYSELKSIGKVRKLGRCLPHALKQYDMDCGTPSPHAQAQEQARKKE